MSDQRYAAFISYRHAEPDRKWATWLHASLERYRTPKALVRDRLLRPRIGRCFRDEEELPASADLSKEIEAALEQSEFLIVVCSPRTPESEWIDKEVLRFQETNRSDRILALLIEGEPEESFPTALREPLAADARDLGSEGLRRTKHLAKLRLVAPLLGCDFDDLRQRERERRSRRRLLTATTLGLFVVVLAVLTGFALTESSRAQRSADEADEARSETEQALLDSYEEQGRQSLFEGKPLQALVYLSEVYSQRSDSSSLKFLLSRATAQLPLVEIEGRAYGYSRDFTSVVTVGPNHTVQLWDTRTGRLRHALVGHTEFVRSAAFTADNTRLVTSADDLTVRIWDTRTGELKRLIAPPYAGVGPPIVHATISPDGMQVATWDWGPSTKIWDAETGELLRTLGHPDPWGSTDFVVFSPDGSRLAAGSGSVFMWDTTDWRRIARLRVQEGGDEESGGSIFATFSPDGGRVVSGAGLYDADTGKLVTLLESESAVRSADFSPDSRLLATGSSDGIVVVWDAALGERLLPLGDGNETPADVTFGPNGRLVAASGPDSPTLVWNAETGRQIARLEGQTIGLSAVAFSPDGARVVTTTLDGTAKVWGTETGALLASLRGGERGVGAAFSGDGQSIVTLEEDRVRVWKAESGGLLGTLKGHEGELYHAAFSPNAMLIVTAGADKTAKLWDGDTGALRASLDGHNSTVWFSTFSADGRLVATGDFGNAYVWDTESGTRIAAIGGFTGSISLLASSPDGSRILVGDTVTKPIVLEVETGSEIVSLDCEQVHRAHFSPDGSRIATIDASGRVQMWDVATGGELLSIETTLGVTMALSGDGTQILTVEPKRPGRLWDAATGEPLPIDRFWGIGSGPPSGGLPGSVVFGPDFRRAAVLNPRETVEAWDVATGEVLPALEGHPAGIVGVAFSPSGEFIGTGGLDGSVRLWDAASGRLLFSFEGHVGPVLPVSFSPDGLRLLTAGSDGLAMVWDVRVESRTPAQIAELATRYAPYRLVDGRLVLTTGREKR